MRKEDGGLAGFDFGDHSNTKMAISAVFKALKYFISDGEMQDILNILPAELKKFVYIFCTCLSNNLMHYIHYYSYF